MRTLYGFIKLDWWMNIVSWRFKLGLLLQIVNIWVLVWPLRRVTDHYQLPIGIGVVGFLYSNDFFLLVSCVSLLLIFSNLPLTTTIQAYSRFRSSSLIWMVAQLIYIVCMSVLYVLITLLTMMLILFGRLSLSSEWGKVLGSIAHYIGMSTEFNIDIRVPTEIISNASPLSVVVNAITLLFLVSVFSGITILTFNLLKTGIGITLYAFLIVLHQGVLLFGDYRLLYLTPLSWLSLTNLSTHAFDAYPSQIYAFNFLLLLIALQVIVCLYYAMYRHDKLTGLFI